MNGSEGGTSGEGALVLRLGGVGEIQQLLPCNRSGLSNRWLGRCLGIMAWQES